MATKEEMVVKLFAMSKSDVTQLFIMLTLKHKKLLEENAKLKGKLRARGEALGITES